MPIYRSPPIAVPVPPDGFRRADIVFEGVEQAGPSFQARVFVGNLTADEQTPRTAADGYAGAFHVYGFGEPSDVHRGPSRAPITKYVVATAAVRAALARSQRLVVTVVPLPSSVVLQPSRVSVVLDPD